MVSIHKTINLDYETIKITEELQAKGINLSELIREFLKKYTTEQKGMKEKKQNEIGKGEIL